MEGAEKRFLQRKRNFSGMREEKKNGWGRNRKVVIKERDIEVQERFEKVQKSKWNGWYKEIRTIGLPRY